jgi:hypothetical protein
MTFTNTNFYIAVDKGLKVIQSCDNMEQLKHAETYVDLVKNRFSDLFIEDNKTIIKQYKLLRSYIQYQHVIIKNK